MAGNPSPVLDPSDDRFGTILNCAVRYACGRHADMPSLVIGYITPLLPDLNDKTLWCFDQDLTEAKHAGGYGDPKIDEPGWKRFHEAARSEQTKRGNPLYRSRRGEDGK